MLRLYDQNPYELTEARAEDDILFHLYNLLVESAPLSLVDRIDVWKQDIDIYLDQPDDGETTSDEMREIIAKVWDLVDEEKYKKAKGVLKKLLTTPAEQRNRRYYWEMLLIYAEMNDNKQFKSLAWEFFQKYPGPDSKTMYLGTLLAEGDYNTLGEEIASFDIVQILGTRNIHVGYLAGYLNCLSAILTERDPRLGVELLRMVKRAPVHLRPYISKLFTFNKNSLLVKIRCLYDFYNL